MKPWLVPVLWSLYCTQWNNLIDTYTKIIACTQDSLYCPKSKTKHIEAQPSKISHIPSIIERKKKRWALCQREIISWK